MLSQVKAFGFTPMQGDGSEDLAFWEICALRHISEKHKTFHVQTVLELSVQMDLFITACNNQCQGHD